MVSQGIDPYSERKEEGREVKKQEEGSARFSMVDKH